MSDSDLDQGTTQNQTSWGMSEISVFLYVWFCVTVFHIEITEDWLLYSVQCCGLVVRLFHFSDYFLPRE
jgi:hypothetical protein